jgi:sugar phosphate isomerase/epimerase
MNIGLDSFSYHRYFGENTPWETPLDTRWTTGDFLRRAYALGVSAVSLQTVYLPDLTPHVIMELSAEIRPLGLKPVLAWGHRSGLEAGLNPAKAESLLRTIKLARGLGCRIMRLVCGDQFNWSEAPEARFARLLPILREATAEAEERGLTLAIENHADFNMRDLVTLVERVGSKRLGICFDSGNAARVGDDVLEAAQLAAPYTKMVHLKDMVIQAESRGDPTAWWPSAPLGSGEFDIPALIRILRAGGFDGTLFVELTNMHPNWPDEDAAVAQSVAYLRDYLQIQGKEEAGGKEQDIL